MAATNLTGTIYSYVVNPDGSPSTTGQVQQDSTDPTTPGPIYPFNDNNFPSLNLEDGEKCFFDLTDKNVAINLRAFTNTQTITGPYTGDLVANSGDVITIKTAAAVINGSITINGGQVNLNNNASIAKGTPVNVNANGVLVARTGGQVNGGVIMNSGGSLKVVNGGKVLGGVVANSGNRLQVGNKKGPGSISGTLSITGIQDFNMTSGSSITS
ncbi:MAG TPA: hypothetical protein VK835_04115 [Bacteroidia bacterium]|nr:hypothetical protein [Bacteroidia bacterium]